MWKLHDRIWIWQKASVCASTLRHDWWQSNLSLIEFMILMMSCAVYLPTLPNKSISSALQRWLIVANTKYYLVVKLKYIMCGIFLLLNDLCTVCTCNDVCWSIRGYSYIKVTGSKSRLNKIYISEFLLCCANDSLYVRWVYLYIMEWYQFFRV